MTNGFVTWWAEQMRALLPASVLRRPSWRSTLVATLDERGGSVALAIRSCRGTAQLGRFGLDDPGLPAVLARVPKAAARRLLVAIPGSAVLRSSVVVPLSAELDLRALLSFELNRLTPFQPDQVFWSGLVERRDARQNRLHVRLLVVPRRRLEPVLSGLRAAGLAPSRVEVAGRGGPPDLIGLDTAPSIRGALGRRGHAWAGGLCGALGLVAVMLPFAGQSAVAARLQARIDAMRPQLQEAERLRGQIAAARTTNDVVTAARQQFGQVLPTLAILTDVLPDDTMLFQLTTRQRTVAFNRKSASAARLIGVMTAHPAIRAPAFAAPVIRDEAGGTEAFSIRAELVP